MLQLHHHNTASRQLPILVGNLGDGEEDAGRGGGERSEKFCLQHWGLMSSCRCRGFAFLEFHASKNTCKIKIRRERKQTERDWDGVAIWSVEIAPSINWLSWLLDDILGWPLVVEIFDGWGVKMVCGWWKSDLEIAGWDKPGSWRGMLPGLELWQGEVGMMEEARRKMIRLG